MRMTLLVGNPKAGSRTLRLGQEVAAKVGAVYGCPAATAIDLAHHAGAMFAPRGTPIDDLVQTVCESDLLVVASPTYKGTYTGLLKAFLDRFPTNALRGVTALPVMTADSPTHALAVEVSLRPLLVELGASCPTRGLTIVMNGDPDRHLAVDKWVAHDLASAAMPILPSPH